MLDELGILDDMKKVMICKLGVMFISTAGKKKNTNCFNKVIHDESALPFHVLRSTFDDMLLQNSKKYVATVFEETKVTHVELDRPDETVKVDMKDNSSIQETFKCIDGAYKLIAKFIYYFYNAKALNLAELDENNMELSDHINHETSFQLLHYLLAGDFFSEHEKYNEMIDLLQDPKHYMRFKNFALDKHDRTTATCDYKTADSYSKELMELFKSEQ